MSHKNIKVAAQQELFRSTIVKPSHELGNAHLELQRAIIKNAQIQGAVNKALYKLSVINTTDEKLEKTIDDIIAILEG